MTALPTAGTNGSTTTTGRIGSLDGLRGIFALTVMVGHFALFTNHFQAGAFKNVALCVQFFFILSGFALSYGFMDRMGWGNVSLRSFGWQRLVRLYPVHIVSMAAAGYFVPPLMGVLTQSGNLPLDTVLNVLLLQATGITHTWSWNLASWSISTEFWVGLFVLPLAFKFISARWAFLLSVIGYGAIFVVLGTIRTQFAYVVPGVMSAVVSTASGLLLGASLYRRAAAVGFNASLGKTARVIAGLIEAALLAGVLYIASIAIHGGIEFVCVAAMPVIIYSVVVSRSWMSRLLSTRPLVWLGHVSYSLYLLHIPVLGALYICGLERIESVPLRFGIFAASSFVSAYLCYRFIEMPAYSRLRRYVPGRARTTQVETAA